ncbi:MAG: hypothetical protein ABI606_05080 [Rhodoferax sp.]
MHHHPTCRHLLATLLLGSLALGYAGAGAQTTAPPASQFPTVEAVASPTAYASPVVYRSVFVDTPTGIDAEETDWRKANAEAGQFKRGHIDILRWENAQAGKPSEATKNIAPGSGNVEVKP